MLISVSISPHSVTGIKVDEKNNTIEPFSFLLPFNDFKSLSKEYWDEVVKKIYKTAGCDEDTKIIISSKESSQFSGSDIELDNKIFDLFSNIPLNLLYIGDYKGYANKIILPLVINPTDFYRWFHLADSINEVENAFYNRKSYGIAFTKDLWSASFEEALFREKLSFLMENIANEYLDKTDELVLTGEGLLFVEDPKKVLLSFLDSCKTTGFWRLYLDEKNSITNILGVSAVDKNLSKKLLDNFVLSDIAGCLVVPEFKDLEIRFSDGEKVVLELEEDSVSVLPLEKENTVDIKASGNRKAEYFKVSGGDFGLLIDNRSRPLLKNKGSKERLNSIENWAKSMESKIDLGGLRDTSGESLDAEPKDVENKKDLESSEKESDDSSKESKVEKVSDKKEKDSEDAVKKDKKKAESEKSEEPKNNKDKDKEDSDKKKKNSKDEIKKDEKKLETKEKEGAEVKKGKSDEKKSDEEVKEEEKEKDKKDNKKSKDKNKKKDKKSKSKEKDKNDNKNEKKDENESEEKNTNKDDKEKLLDSVVEELKMEEEEPLEEEKVSKKEDSEEKVEEDEKEEKVKDKSAKEETKDEKKEEKSKKKDDSSEKEEQKGTDPRGSVDVAEL